MGRCFYSPQSTSNALYFPEKLMLGETLDSEFKLLRIRELDNDDVDGKPDSTDEDTHPNFSMAYELWCGVKRTSVASYEIQVNVMQKSVMYWKWTNVVDIYCKLAKKSEFISLPQVQVVVGSCSNSRNPCNAWFTQPTFGAKRGTNVRNQH